MKFYINHYPLANIYISLILYIYCLCVYYLYIILYSYTLIFIFLLFFPSVHILHIDDFNSSTISQIDIFNQTEKKTADQIAKTLRFFANQNIVSVNHEELGGEGKDEAKSGKKLKVGCKSIFLLLKF